MRFASDSTEVYNNCKVFFQTFSLFGLPLGESIASVVPPCIHHCKILITRRIPIFILNLIQSDSNGRSIECLFPNNVTTKLNSWVLTSWRHWKSVKNRNTELRKVANLAVINLSATSTAHTFINEIGRQKTRSRAYNTCLNQKKNEFILEFIQILLFFCKPTSNVQRVLTCASVPWVAVFLV